MASLTILIQSSGLLNFFLFVTSSTQTSALFYVHCSVIPHEECSHLKNYWFYNLSNIRWNCGRDITRCYWLWLNWNTHECISPHMSFFLRQNVSGKTVYISNCVFYHRAHFSVQNHISQDFVIGLRLAIAFTPTPELSMNLHFNLMDLERCITIWYIILSLKSRWPAGLILPF